MRWKPPTCAFVSGLVQNFRLIVWANCVRLQETAGLPYDRRRTSCAAGNSGANLKACHCEERSDAAIRLPPSSLYKSKRVFRFESKKEGTQHKTSKSVIPSQ